MFEEFKKFALRGNVVDMAVGIIIGGAFGKIVSSLVKDVMMPPIGMVLGQVNFNQLFINLSATPYASLKEAQEAGAPTLNYGIFVSTILDFIILAFAIFIMVKMMNRLKKKQEEAPAKEPSPSKEEVLLTEIRDLLKK
ncbi:MAG: large-conductance mechanosensitive channel protein MscL [Deltaproteobacteria bacterium]|nr:large-conductance mechanosensitive channel protein MscL [Deltaproteobacteria bacterium]